MVKKRIQRSFQVFDLNKEIDEIGIYTRVNAWK